VSVYVDASVLVALFTPDVRSGRADAFLRARAPILLVSDFAAAEFASAVARLVRMGHLEADAARRALAAFDAWIARAAERILATSADIMAAVAFLRRFDLPIRTPDALNIVIVQRVAAELLTFDQKMAASARALGTTVVAL
jgi:predicted nucleic acid-binding protein